MNTTNEREHCEAMERIIRAAANQFDLVELGRKIVLNHVANAFASRLSELRAQDDAGGEEKGEWEKERDRVRSIAAQAAQAVRERKASQGAGGEEKECAVLDLGNLAWEGIKEAASKSPWMPPQYMMNDWVSDVFRFLTEPDEPQPTPCSTAGQAEEDERAWAETLNRYRWKGAEIVCANAAFTAALAYARRSAVVPNTESLAWGVEETTDRFWVGPMRRDGLKVNEVVFSLEKNGLKPDAITLNRQRAHLVAQCVNNAGPQSNRIRELEGVISEDRRSAVPADPGCHEARRLAESIWRAEYQKEAPNWKPLDNTAGIISQIDNMYAGVRQQRDQALFDLNALKQAAVPADGLVKALEDIRRRSSTNASVFSLDVHAIAADALSAYRAQTEGK